MRTFLILNFLLAMLFSVGSFGQSSASSSPTSLELGKGDIIPGRFIVTVTDGAEPEDVAKDHGIAPDHIYHHAMKGFAGKWSDFVHSGLIKDPRTKKAEHDRVITASTSQLNPTWGLDRIDQHALPLNSVYTYNFTGSGVTAYIIDTGIRYDHVEFGGRASFGYDSFGGNGSDCNGHGTHVSGTVGGATYGVAKNVKLVAVRVLDCSGSGSTSGVIAGVDWVAAHRVLPAVANMSLGGSVSPSLDSAVNTLINSGVSTAVAAGNSGADACNSSPSDVPNAMTVGATDSRDTRPSWSNFGACVDWFAPGVSITSSVNTSSTATAIYSGTSMASPHTAGVAALYLERHPTASPQAVKDALWSIAGKNIVVGSNSASDALLYSLEPPTTPTPYPEPTATATPVPTPVPTPIPTPTPTPFPGDSQPPTAAITAPADGARVIKHSYVTIQATASDNVGVTKVDFIVDSNLRCTSTSAPYTCTFRAAPQSGRTHRIQVRPWDAAGNWGMSQMVTIMTQ